jgi:hypothetical protein
VWVVDLATRFWDGIPELPPPFPRDLAIPLACLQHIHLVELPDLSLARASQFLQRAGVPFPIDGHDRLLHGCLATHRGRGYILLSSNDDETERRFTLAHELAHFLRDYEAPRRRAVTRIGPSVLEVLDGQRAATHEERLSGLLYGVAVGCHTHLLARDDKGRPASPAIRQAEEAADRLAFELLAPIESVVAGPADERKSLAEWLTSTFGLPMGQAAKYAELLFPSDC